MKLQISDDISLPVDTATQTIAILARKRVGKTYTASVMAEELIKAEIPIVVFDPTGAWWGLRSSANGKKAGFPVVIIGGEHADVPLEDTAGNIIADLVVDHPGYYVIDFSKFEHDTQIVKFATAFGKRFYFRKEQHRFPIQLIIDEADIVLPQKPQANETVMLHTYDGIVRRGGIRGIGVTIISQRPAVVNKNVLTQCETLIVLQISGSQDIDAIEHWTRVHGSDAERKELLSSVATLQRGEAWIWSPSWLQVFKKIRIRERITFNSSATPKAGEKVVIPEKLAAVDIAALGEQIKATVERSKQNDPEVLHKHIAALKHENQTLLQRANEQAPAREVHIVTNDDLRVVKDVLLACESAQKQADDLTRSIDDLKGECGRISARLESIQNSPFKQPVPKPYPQGVIVHARQTGKTQALRQEANGELGKAERAILQALANCDGRGTIKKVAILARYTASGGSFRNAIGKLRSLGIVDKGDPVAVTDYGRNYLPEARRVSGEDLYDQWKEHDLLGNAEREILRVLWENRDGVCPMMPDQIASRCKSSSNEPYEATGGSFRNALGKLRSLELVNRGTPIGLTEEFFL